MATEHDSLIDSNVPPVLENSAPSSITMRESVTRQRDGYQSLLPGLRDSLPMISTSSMLEVDLVQSLTTSGTSWLGGSFIMANVCIGMGLLHFPKTVESAGGILPSFILLTIFVLLIIGSLAVIAHCCGHYGCVSYQDMVTVHCGLYMGVLCQIFLFMETLGSCMVKLVVFGDQIERITKLATHENEITKWYLNTKLLLFLFSSLIILPLCLLKNFQVFKYLSPVGILAAIYITCLAVVRYYTSEKSQIPITDTSRVPNIITLFPLLVYAFHGHVEAPVVWCCLRRQRVSYFMRLTLFYLLIAVLLYGITAVFGALTFGPNVDDDLLLAYSIDDPMANVGAVLIVLKLCSSFPIIFYITRSVFDQFWRRFLIHRLPEKLGRDDPRRIIQTVILFLACVSVAMGVNNMNKAISLIGGISCNFAFTFPGMCLMMLHLNKENKTVYDKLFICIGIFFLIFGVYLMGMNTTLAIQNFLIKDEDGY